MWVVTRQGMPGSALSQWLCCVALELFLLLG